MARRKKRKPKKGNSSFTKKLFFISILFTILLIALLFFSGAMQGIKNRAAGKASLMADRVDELILSLKRRSGPPSVETGRQEETGPSTKDQATKDPAKKYSPASPENGKPLEEPATEEEKQRLEELLESH